jgi:hypothetical protein
MIGVVSSSFVRGTAVQPLTRYAFAAPPVGFDSVDSTKTVTFTNLAAGDLIVVMGTAGAAYQTMSTPTSSIGITWTLRQQILITDWSPGYLWTGTVPSASVSATVSVACVANGTPWNFTGTVWRNHNGFNTVKTNNTGSPRLDISTSANSAVQFMNGDWNAVPGNNRIYYPINGTPMAEDHYGYVGGVYTIYGAYTLNVGAGGLTSMGLSQPAGQKYSMVGIEIKSL